jgi:hypothetical protein
VGDVPVERRVLVGDKLAAAAAVEGCNTVAVVLAVDTVAERLVDSTAEGVLRTQGAEQDTELAVEEPAGALAFEQWGFAAPDNPADLALDKAGAADPAPVLVDLEGKLV